MAVTNSKEYITIECFYPEVQAKYIIIVIIKDQTYKEKEELDENVSCSVFQDKELEVQCWTNLQVSHTAQINRKPFAERFVAFTAT